MAVFVYNIIIFHDKKVVEGVYRNTVRVDFFVFHVYILHHSVGEVKDYFNNGTSIFASINCSAYTTCDPDRSCQRTDAKSTLGRSADACLPRTTGAGD